jgi:hypothetical protein
MPRPLPRTANTVTLEYCATMMVIAPGWLGSREATALVQSPRAPLPLVGTACQRRHVSHGEQRRGAHRGMAVEVRDVIIATYKTIDLVFRTQVYKPKRDMPARSRP